MNDLLDDFSSMSPFLIHCSPLNVSAQLNDFIHVRDLQDKPTDQISYSVLTPTSPQSPPHHSA